MIPNPQAFLDDYLRKVRKDGSFKAIEQGDSLAAMRNLSQLQGQLANPKLPPSERQRLGQALDAQNAALQLMSANSAPVTQARPMPDVAPRAVLPDGRAPAAAAVLDRAPVAAEAKALVNTDFTNQADKAAGLKRLLELMQQGFKRPSDINTLANVPVGSSLKPLLSPEYDSIARNRNLFDTAALAEAYAKLPPQMFGLLRI